MAETVGLVLAVVPLLISALEHCEDVVEPTMRFMQWRSQRRKVIRQLYMERTSYDQNIRLLLRYAVDEAELTEMVDNPASHHWSHWKKSTLANDLGDRLGDAYVPCMDTIRDISEIMASIAKCLGIEGADKVTTQGLGAIVHANTPSSSQKGSSHGLKFEFRKQIAFTTKWRTAKKLLDEFGSCNARLAGFMEKADRLQESMPGPGRTRVKFVAPLSSIRENATRVHKSLCRTWCEHQPVHHAGIRLEQRLVRRAKRMGIRERLGKCDCFGISLQKTSFLSWVETEFYLDQQHYTHIFASHEAGETASIKHHGPINGYTPPENVPIRSRDGHRTVRVAFSNDLGNPALSLPKVSDICSTLESASHPLLGFRVDSSDTLRGLCETETPPPRLVSNRSDTVSLSHLVPGIKNLPLKDFYILAITLASSILQLGDTPWLQRRQWNKHAILFLRLKDGDNEKVDVQHPYLLSEYESMAGLSQKSRPLVGPNMLSLAIMLLEISFATAVDSYLNAEDLGSDGQPNEMTSFTTATRWLMLVNDRLTAGFRSAITYCIQCYVDPLASFGNPDFSKAVEEKVLQPLEQEMHWACGTWA